MRQALHGDLPEARLGEHPTGRFGAPHRPEPGPVAGERHGHAVHARDRVEEGAHRVLAVAVDVTGARDVLHQEEPVGTQRLRDAGEHLRRLRLVVDGVEGRDQIEGVGRVDGRDVLHLEAEVVETAGVGLALRRCHAFVREVVAGEAAGREAGSELRQCATAAAAHVEHVDAGLEPTEQAWNARQDLVDETRDHGLIALLGHHRVEALVGRVWNAAAALEALDHGVLDAAEQRDPLAGDRHVARPRVARETGRVLGRQHVGRGGRVESNDAIGSATALTLIDDPLGSGLITGYGEGEINPATSNNTWSDPDYWEFPALAGDVITVAVATPTSDVDPYVELRNSADGVLRSDNNGGADGDALITRYTVGTSGNYFVRVGKDAASSISGDYQLRVDIARGINLEADTNYANDSIGSAYRPDLNQGAPGSVGGFVAGTIMAAEGANTDEDYFSLGTLDPGNVVNLTTMLPAVSTLDSLVRVVDSSGTDVPDTDGDATDGSFVGTIGTRDDYYAVVEANSGSGPIAQYLLEVDIADVVPPTITGLTGLPADGTTSSEVISSLTVSFSERMDPDSVVAPGSIDLRRAGPDTFFDTADDVIVSLVPTSAFTQFDTTIELLLEDGPLSSGDYRFQVTNQTEDRASNQIDGDGDGAGGDAYEIFFTLDLPAEFVLEGPNNGTIGGATALPLTEVPGASGRFEAYGLGSQDPAIPNDWWSDVDYWSFQAQAGDRLSVSVDTPDSGLDPYFEIRNSGDGYLTGDNNGGPNSDALTSHYTIPTTSTYYVRVGKNHGSSVAGSYQIGLLIARGLDLESDLSYHNDTIGNADPVSLVQQGSDRVGRVTGNIMAPEGSNTDEDRFQLGLLNAGNVVELQVELPASSS